MEQINSGVFDISNALCIAFVEGYKSKKKFISDFKILFNYVRAYHGTNLNDPERVDMLENGLRKTSTSLLRQKALQRFIANDDSELVKEKISKIILDYFKKEKPITLGEINFSTDEQLVYEHYHYHLFGSETLLALAGKLKDEINLPFRQRMADFGKHTIAVVNLPIKLVGNLWLGCIYEYINGGFPESSIVIRTSLSSENIVELKTVDRPFDVRGFVDM